MNHRLIWFAGLVLLILVGCGGAQASTTPAPSPSHGPGQAQSIAALRLAIIDRFGPLWYCDPDFYPLQRGEEIDHARERWTEVMADTEAFLAIAATRGLNPAGPFADVQKLAVYQSWKILNAIALDPIGNDTYRFDYLAQPPAGGTEGSRIGGTITSTGTIAIEQQAAAGEPICPICLSRGSRIDTPRGPVAVETIRVGDQAWTVDADGRRVAATVIAVGSTMAPVGHHVIRIVLADGRSVTASPGHPLADGRLIGDLRPGDGVDGTTVTTADQVAYEGGRTFDLIVSGPTGAYFVDGIALGSTLLP